MELSTEDLENVFYLLLSEGTYITSDIWQGEYNGLNAIYNGGDTVYSFSQSMQEDGYYLLYGDAVPTLSEGTLSAEISPHSLLVLAEGAGDGRGFLKNNILYRRPLPNSTVQCEEDAMLGFYITYNGKPELTGLYVNGDEILDGEGTFRFFRWENMQPK